VFLCAALQSGSTPDILAAPSGGHSPLHKFCARFKNPKLGAQPRDRLVKHFAESLTSVQARILQLLSIPTAVCGPRQVALLLVAASKAVRNQSAGCRVKRFTIGAPGRALQNLAMNVTANASRSSCWLEATKPSRAALTFQSIASSPPHGWRTDTTREQPSVNGDAAIAHQIGVGYKRGAVSITVRHGRSIRGPPCSCGGDWIASRGCISTWPHEMSEAMSLAAIQR
jgi:hypothetical protein